MPISSDSAPGERERHPAVLRLTGVEAGYGGAAIVSDVSISVGPGEVVSVIGPNGAGKSTLLKAVTGRLPVMAGTVTFKDRDVTNWRGHLLARMGLGFVPQTKDVFDTLTVTENLEMGGYLLTKPQLAARIDKVMSTFPALANMRSRTASKLSGGAGADGRANRSRPRRTDLQPVAGAVPVGAPGPGPAPGRLRDGCAAGRAEGIRGARCVRLDLHSGCGAG